MESPSPLPSAEAVPVLDPSLAALQQILGPEAILECQGKLPAFRVPATAIHAAGQKLKVAGFDYLVLLTAVDYPAQQKLEVVYVLSTFQDSRVACLVADVPRDHPRIASVCELWPTADWHERETYDLLGVHFENHPDLRRILLDDTWEGHPLRKDYVDTLHGVVKRPY